MFKVDGYNVTVFEGPKDRIKYFKSILVTTYKQEFRFNKRNKLRFKTVKLAEKCFSLVKEKKLEEKCKVTIELKKKTIMISTFKEVTSYTCVDEGIKNPNHYKDTLAHYE